ncbi:helix-turn-helix domain-containing protein [Cytobacillus sp. Hz8]|uniref:helix-turn-helix domain-containing protein n=1 Tax=Cytobacillus sp. Hz8 TaxID=3347168 RepID=UPI0035DFB336
MSGTTSTKNFTLLYVKCDYLKVGQFAELHNVTETTVRQWIRRGKLRTAKKVGRDWLMPSIAEKPSRGFRSISNYWVLLLKTIEDQFLYLNNFNCIYIFQNKDDKTTFDCILGYPGAKNRKKLLLTSSEIENKN